jgi:hypothetical protein
MGSARPLNMVGKARNDTAKGTRAYNLQAAAGRMRVRTHRSQLVQVDRTSAPAALYP